MLPRTPVKNQFQPNINNNDNNNFLNNLLQFPPHSSPSVNVPVTSHVKEQPDLDQISGSMLNSTANNNNNAVGTSTSVIVATFPNNNNISEVLPLPGATHTQLQPLCYKMLFSHELD